MDRWLVAALIMIAPGVASAQTPRGASPAPRVELEAYGGLGRLLDAGAATVTLPAAGAPIATSNPMFPSRRVPSWFFGAGAALLNAVNAELGLAPRITPLDDAIAMIGRTAQSGAGMGARIRFRTAPRVWTELAVDLSPTSTTAPESLMAAVEATRGSFVQAMTSLLASGPFTGTNVTATATPLSGSWRDVTTSVAANVELNPIAGLTPSVTLGGGFVMRTGTQSAVSLEGRYRTRILGAVPIDETDRVTIRGEARNAPAIVIGAGLSREVASRLRLRLDARLIAANRTIASNIDASPTVASGTPADFIESFTNPSVQFSNNASTGRLSTLSGDALDHADAARSTRLQARVVVTIGVAFKF
jgi:hypothetical protein